MKNYFLLSFFTIALAASANSQTKVSKDLNATSGDVQIISTNPDAGKHATIYAGLFGPEGVNVLGASFYKPKTIYLNAMAGANSAMVDGSLFFFSKMKEGRLQQTVSAGNNLKYKVVAPLEKRESIGVHAGYNHVNYSLLSSGVNGFSTNGIFGGITLLSSRHADWKINSTNKESQASSIGRINADIIYYTNRTLNAPIDGKQQPGINDVSRKLGFRIYLDGKTSAWSKTGRAAFQYMVGVGQNSDKTRTLAPFVGFGIGYNFL